MQRKIK